MFPFKKDSHGESPRQKRQRTRETRSVIQDSQPPEDVQSEVVIESTPLSASSEVFMAGTCTLPTSTSTQSTQCDINSLGKFTVENFRNNAKMINYYTGFIDYAQFMLFYHCLGPCVNELGHLGSILDPRDQLFMVLMKLRQAKEDVELSLFFQVSESTVSRIVVTWINFLYFQLKELDIWPSREILQEYMPVDFKRKFPNTRVILDATELPIQKPSEVNAQSVTWSAYKHKNTLKAMIGCTPRGVVSFVSDAYGGSASDRQIIENSSLLHQSMFDKGDSIMADRGIMVQDLFATKDVYVNTPTMLKGKSQLDPEEVVNDRRVASKRIHIERIIGLSKGFKILKKELPQSKLQLGSRIVFVCFSISNFRNCIVDKYA